MSARRVTPGSTLSPGGPEDVRARVVVTVLFVVVVVITPIRWWPAYVAEAILVGAAYAIGGRPWRLLLVRLAAVLPFLVLIAGSVVLSRAMQGGWELAAQILCRAVLALAAMATLTVTTPFPAILTAMARLHMPDTLVSILAFMYRYIFVLGDELTRMRRAKAARTFQGDWRTELVVAAHLSGMLFVRAFERAERVHAAMCARGWTGRFYSPDVEK